MAREQFRYDETVCDICGSVITKGSAYGGSLNGWMHAACLQRATAPKVERRHPNSVAARALVTAFVNYMLELHDLTPEECGSITITPGKISKVVVFLRKENGEKFVLITEEDCKLARSLGATDAEIVCGDIATRMSEQRVHWNSDEIKAFQSE